MRQIGEIIEGHPLFHVQSTSTVRDAARTMSDRNIGAIAVLDSGKLVGTRRPHTHRCRGTQS